MDDQDDLQDDAATNAVAIAAAIAAARILEVRYCLEVCGLNQQMTDAIILEEYSKTTDFSMMSSKQMDAIAYLLGKTPANRGGVKIPAMMALNVVAFGTWVKGVKRRGQAVEAVLFTNEVLEVFKERLDRPDTDATAVVSPGAYKDSTSWGEYDLSVSNFLSTIKGMSDVPLSYVIRKDRVNSTLFSSDTEELVYSAPLIGEVFKSRLGQGLPDPRGIDPKHSSLGLDQGAGQGCLRQKVDDYLAHPLRRTRHDSSSPRERQDHH